MMVFVVGILVMTSPVGKSYTLGLYGLLFIVMLNFGAKHVMRANVQVHGN